MTLLALDILWFIWVAKYLLFWLFLWQLKEYHVGRFADHFRTDKGKRLLLDIAQIFKLFCILLLLVSSEAFSYLLPILFLLYTAEFLLVLRAVLTKEIRIPVKTAKSMFLTGVSFVLVIVFLGIITGFQPRIQTLLLLAVDVLLPIIISAVVLTCQPFFVVIRNNIVRKAKDKLERVRLGGKFTVIAITGSYGKTSTKEFLTTILAKKYKVLSTNKHQNSEIGIANCILRDLNVRPGGYPEIFIAEVGAYNKGKVKEVCSFIKPDVGIVTGVNEQHMALFGSLDNLLSAEGGGELADAMGEDGLLVVNGDNKYCLDLYKRRNGRKRVYSLNNRTIDSDMWTEEIEIGRDFVSFIALDKKGELMHFKAAVLGKHNVQNLLGSILVARELGMSFEKISEACKSIIQEQGGTILKRSKHGIEIVDSSYSANPDGVFADLEYFSVFGADLISPGLREAKKVVVMPCLIELGEKSAEIHEKIGKKIGEVCDMAVITSKDKFEEIERGFNETKKEGAQCLLCDKSQDIFSLVTLFCKEGDAILLEGRVPAGLIKLLI